MLRPGEKPGLCVCVCRIEDLESFAGAKEAYEKSVVAYFEELKLKCAQYRIKYVDVDVRSDFSKVLNTYLVERQKFL